MEERSILEDSWLEKFMDELERQSCEQGGDGSQEVESITKDCGLGG